MRIGFPTGYKSDDPRGPAQLVEAGVEYIAMDFLGETGTTGLVRDRERDPSLGHARTFLPMVSNLLDQVAAGEVTLLANAGGLNPEALTAALLEAIGDRSITVGTVTGDDVLEHLPSLEAAGVRFENVDTGEPFSRIRDRVVAANAYLGGFPVADALAAGADIVVTGRAVDPAAALGPMIHEFGWGREDYDLLAAGLTAGHVGECGSQATGGRSMATWRTVDPANWGHPIVEIEADGSFVVTKPEGTGGVVTEAAVIEQLLYEIKDPKRYHSPDVTADFTRLAVEAVGTDRVAVSGCRGTSPPDTLKLAVYYRDGYRVSSIDIYSWPDALEKARWEEAVIRERAEGRVDEVRTELLGYNGCHDGLAAEPEDPPEILLRFAARDEDPELLAELLRTARLGIRGPPSAWNVTMAGPTEVFGFWPTAIPKTEVLPEVTVTGGGA